MRLLCLLVLISLFAADRTCESDSEDRNKSQALKYELDATTSINVAGAMTVCLPILGSTVLALHSERNIFFVIKAFAAGLILSTGFIHFFLDAFESLTSPCLSEIPWGDFLLVAMGTPTVDTLATFYFKNLLPIRPDRTKAAEMKRRLEKTKVMYMFTSMQFMSTRTVTGSDSELLRIE